MDVRTRAIISSRDVRFPRNDASLVLPSLISPLASESHDEVNLEEGFVSELPLANVGGGNSGISDHPNNERLPSLTSYGGNSQNSETISCVLPAERSILELASALAKNFPAQSDDTGPPTPLLNSEEDAILVNPTQDGRNSLSSSDTDASARDEGPLISLNTLPSS